MSPPGQAAALAGTRLPGNQVPQGTGVPAPSNPEVPEQGAETAASSCSIPTLAPVTFRNARGGNNRAEYHPFPRATIKEICKAHRIYGRDGPYFRGLLKADLSAEEVVPADLKYLFSCLLNPTEYILWVTAWKRLLQEALPGLLNHVNTRVDAQGNPLTLDHLAGEGQWAEATDQVVIPVQCLHVVRETALTAFFSMQTQGPAISYSKIRQGQSESFTDFVERLSRAIEAQVKNEMAREHILSEIAFSNANDLCRAAILSLPLHPKPTLPDMLQGGSKHNTLEMTYTDHDMAQPILTTNSKYTPYRLQLTEGLHPKDDNWNFVSVDNSEQGTWPRVKGKLIVVGDCKHTPKEIEILPGTLDNNPGKFVLWLRCTHPPTFLPKGQTVAQIIPTWEHLEEDNIPTACPVHNITEVKPQVGCELQVGDEAINITGLLDTGAHVTVIPAKHWPSRWALENVAGHVQGIGGMQLARQSKSVVQIKGPEGQLASLRPFVLDYREPLLGRDLMAQWGVTIDIPDPPQDFWVAVAEERPTHKLNWKTDAPVWVEQWPLSKQKLKALEELVEEQLAKGHIVETTSPWNLPVFVIRKPGKDKWRLLQDLRQINNVIEDMGSLQPGMPTPTMLPQNWKLAVIDIKDCFFHIPLHPDDAPRFAFSVPTVNREAPRKRYHWRVLPQGMKVSPIICQWYVASLLSPVRVAAEKAIIHHYMDDVLVCAPTDDVLSHALDLTINALVVAGFELQEDKVQRMPPWRYLGLEIGKRTIVPQKLEIKAKIQTLADVHQLCGTLNWVRPWLGLTTEDLAPLFNLLKGGEELSSPRELTPEAKEALEKVQHLMSTRQAHRCDPDLPFKFIIMGKLPHLHGVIFQWRNNIKKDQGREDPLLIIEWVFLSHQRSKRMTRPQELVAELIRKARVRIRELAGCDFECIHIPIGLRSGQITKAMLEHLLQENEALQFALDSFTGQISIHRPAHKIFNQDAKFTLNLKDVRSRKPLEALTVFTDASGKSHKSVMTWKDPQTQQWEADVAEVEGSPQVAELAAVVRAFERFPEPFNLVTDSAYVAGLVSRADQAILQEVSNTALFELLSKLVKLVSHREQPFFVMHTRSHTDLPGFIAEGNRRADALAAPAAMAPLPSIFEQAKLSHQLHHQNAPGLVRRFHITREQAKAIVATCPSCNQHALPTLSAGVNPRGLNSCELWQTDVTHIPQFGRSKYVHVSVDTFSGAVFASAHAGEKTLDAIKHLIQAFSFMGIPKELKTDNGPAYRSKEFCSFLQQWGVGHKTGIPHSPTGQAVVERTHREIKRVLNQQQPVLKTETPQTRLARALFTLNFLNSTFEFLNPPIVRHFGANPQLNIKERPPVMVRDPETGRTEGPHDLVTWGRGLEHLCGDDEWVAALKQAQEIPLTVLEGIKETAFKAFFSIQPNGSFQPYSKIKHLPSEPFVTFVERLTRAVKLQVMNEGAQEQVLEEMALTNANEQLHAAVGEAIILHYMDDVLVCAPSDDLLSHVLDLTINSLVAAGFELQEENILRMPPWKYLGLETDASGRSRKSVIAWKNPQTQQWEKNIVEVEGSPQVAELAAVVRAFEKFPEPFNLATDLAYVAGVGSRAEQVVLSEVSNSALFNLLSKLVNLISHREQQFYGMHIRSHTDLPGFIAEGNRRADALAAPVEMAPLPDIFGQAKISHQLFHQNAPGLVRQFHLTREQAQAIVSMCPLCQHHTLPALSAGANPRGLNSCEVWQTDATHIMSFGRQRYVHVSVDNFSGAVYASDHTGEKSSDAMKHLIQAFSLLGIPKSIKTDNGLTYTSKEFRSFLQQWGVEHKTGIPYSPTVIQGMQMTAMPIDPELAAKGKPNPLMVLKAKLTHTQKEGPEEMLTEHKETTVAQEMSTKFEKEREKLDTAREMLEKLEAEMRERENLDYWEYRRN
ncbi:hypothetical protein DUI87_06376 [Hirundo rustica rustica]|uniref:Uncharacterized protein n=1 Tax=Hirundo rustica rustica TaxID=333673 RepID=A0A3M0KTZ8_HIRRU|nr:hypothetical protein DUI87_06376 [Hirundo rustica rustica]